MWVQRHVATLHQMGSTSNFRLMPVGTRIVGMTYRPSNPPTTSCSKRSPSGSDLYWRIGVVAESVAALDRTLGEVAASLCDEKTVARVAVVEGPFAGDTPAAVTTAYDWLVRARELLAAEALPAVENAQISISGLADAME